MGKPPLQGPTSRPHPQSVISFGGDSASTTLYIAPPSPLLGTPEFTIPNLSYDPTTPGVTKAATTANIQVPQSTVIPGETETVTQRITTNSDNPTIVVSLPTTTQADPSLAAVSAAIESCVAAPGGVRPDGGVDKGCGKFFAQVTDCFQQNSAWKDPYDQKQSDTFRSCVCAVPKKKEFDEHNAFYKDYSGCASCVLDSGYHIVPWATEGLIDIRSF